MRSFNVLILEDNPFQLMALHQMLNANGVFNVLTAETVETARQSLDSKGPVDIAICDLYLEHGDALALIRELAERRLAQVVVLLSNAEPDVLEGVANMTRQLGLQVLACLPKPASAALIGQVLSDCQVYLHPQSAALSWDHVRQLLGLSAGEQVPPSADLSQASIAYCGRVWYQPIVSQAGVLQGMEALARWQSLDGELLLPDAFLPVLAFAGMEEAFTWHVLEQALGLASQVMGETGQVLPVAVNIPGRMLERAHFSQVLQGLLQRHGVPAHSLTLVRVETSRLKTDSAHVARAQSAADYHAVGELGAAWLQGCFIARPMEAEALKQWIASPARLSAWRTAWAT